MTLLYNTLYEKIIVLILVGPIQASHTRVEARVLSLPFMLLVQVWHSSISYQNMTQQSHMVAKFLSLIIES